MRNDTNKGTSSGLSSRLVKISFRMYCRNTDVFSLWSLPGVLSGSGPEIRSDHVSLSASPG